MPFHGDRGRLSCRGFRLFLAPDRRPREASRLYVSGKALQHGGRFFPDLLADNAPAGFVLPECRRATSGKCMQLHQRDMRHLVQGVEGQPPRSVVDSGVVVGHTGQTGDKLLQQSSMDASKRLGLKELPVIKRRAVLEGETGHEILPVQVRGLTERPRTLGTSIIGSDTPQMSLPQLVDIDPQPGIVAEGDLVLLGQQEPRRQRRGQRVERPA